MLRAGTPATSAYGGTSFVTTAPAPTKQYAPSVTPQTIVALAPIVAPRRTSVRLILVPARHVAARVDDVGEDHRRPAEHVVLELHALVDRHVVLDLHVVADLRAVHHHDVLAEAHRSPITAPGITWQKCQILVPPPISAPSSTKARLVDERSARSVMRIVGLPLLERPDRRRAATPAARGSRRTPRCAARHRRGVRHAVRDRRLPQR